MQRISPFLWFDTEAREAAELYTSVFENSKILSSTKMGDTPSGTVEILVIELAGQRFKLMSAGPYFKFTPAISFLVACQTKEEVDGLWARLSEGGTALMELGDYPFSARYGWTADRFGLSWQLMFMGDRPPRQKITPTLMFVGDKAGKAEEAIRHYASVFEGAKVGDILRYEPGEEPDRAGTVKHASFMLAGQEFAAMDSAYLHKFDFNEAVSLEVSCRNQEEIDHYWKLSADPGAEQCGWLKDRYGLSWQIVPSILEELLADEDPAKVAAVSQAFLKMKKFDIAALKSAYRAAESAKN